MGKKMFWLGALLALAIAPATGGELKFADPAMSWVGMAKTVDGVGVLKLVDESQEAGPYLVTGKSIAIDSAKPYTLCALVKTAGNVTSRSQLHLFILDSAGKRIGAVSTPGVTQTGWTEARLDIKPADWPKGAAQIQIALQPAAGPADATGTAEFKELYFGPYLEPRLDLAFEPNKIGWNGMATAFDQNEPGAVKLTDDSKGGGSYLISGAIPVDAARDYRFAAKVKNAGDLTGGRIQIHVFLFDAAGNRVQIVSTPGTTETQWTTLHLELPAKDRVAGVKSVQIALQPAAGPAEATGSAWFKDVTFKVADPVAELDGVDHSKNFFYKTNKIDIADAKDLMGSPFGTPLSSPRLEMSTRIDCDIDAILLATDQTLPLPVQVALWDEERQQYGSPSPMQPEKVSGGYKLTFPAPVLTRKIALEFPGETPVELNRVRIAGPELPLENWQADWIWFTADRVEDITTYLRGEFDLDQVPVRAMLQSVVDDGGILWVNGQRIGDAGGRDNPPVRDIARYLQKGRNVIAAETAQARYAAGLLAELDMIFADGSHRKFMTSDAWKVVTEKPAENWREAGFDSSSWPHAVRLGVPPRGAWGAVPYTMNAPRTALNLTANPVPGTLRAGETYAFKLELTPAKAVPRAPVYLVLKRNGLTFWKKRMGAIGGSAERENLELKFSLSKFLPAGVYELKFQAAGYQLSWNGKPLTWPVEVVNDRKAKMHDAEIKPHNGVPTLMIDGTPEFSNFSAQLLEQLDNHARLFRVAGLHRYHCYVNLGWREPEVPDYTMLDQVVTTLLDGDPDAQIIVKLGLRDSTPTWFLQKYPQEGVRFDNGRGSSRISLASKVWRRVAGENIAGMVRYVSVSPYADKVIGFIASEGEEGQWMHYWAGDDPAVPGTLSDYSQPMLDYFRGWLRRNYADEVALRQAWNDPQVTFDTAPIPSREQRIAAKDAFRDLPRDRAALDYAFALSDVVTEGMEFYGKLIKDAALPAKVVTGALYGHLIDLGAHFLGEQVGYLRQRRAIDSPYLDYFLGPLQYGGAFRDVGGVGSFDMPSPASLKLANKIWLNEDDVRTHLEYPAGYAYSIRTPDATGAMLARQLFKAICAGAGNYWFALGMAHQNWFDDPETVRTLNEIQKIADESVNRDRSKIAEIAVVMSDQSVGFLRQAKGRGTEDQIMLHAIYQREQIGRIGAPFDEYLLDDFLKRDMPDYKFYIFLNAFAVSDAEKGAIQAKLGRNGALALWYYAPGLAGVDGLSPERSTALTGIPFKLDSTRRNGEFELRVRMPELLEKTRFGRNDLTYAPWLVPQQYDELYAVFAGSDTPAVVRKGRSCFAPLGVLPTELLRRMAEEAGVEILSRDNIAVYGCKSYIGIHSSKVVAPMTLNAPKGKSLRQLYPAKDGADWITSFEWQNAKPETWFFEVR